MPSLQHIASPKYKLHRRCYIHRCLQGGETLNVSVSCSEWQCVIATWMHSNAAWKKKKCHNKGTDEPRRVKHERKRGRMKEGGRERSCSISSTGERFKGWNSILGSTGQAGLVCMGAHFLCVISRRESVRMCVCALGDCSSERSGVVLSARGGKECPNQTQWTGCLEREREKDEGQTERVSTYRARRKMGRETGSRESSRQKALTKERRREHQRRIEQADWFFICFHWRLRTTFLGCHLHSSWASRWSKNFVYKLDELSDGKSSTSLTSPWTCRTCPNI